MKPAILLATLLFTVSLIIAKTAKVGEIEITDGTKQLCREWAVADHRMVISHERYIWLGGDEYWNNFDWYGSCILNNGPKVVLKD